VAQCTTKTTFVLLYVSPKRSANSRHRIQLEALERNIKILYGDEARIIVLSNTVLPNNADVIKIDAEDPYDAKLRLLEWVPADVERFWFLDTDHLVFEKLPALEGDITLDYDVLDKPGQTYFFTPLIEITSVYGMEKLIYANTGLIGITVNDRTRELFAHAKRLRDERTIVLEDTNVTDEPFLCFALSLASDIDLRDAPWVSIDGWFPGNRTRKCTSHNCTLHHYYANKTNPELVKIYSGLRNGVLPDRKSLMNFTIYDHMWTGVEGELVDYQEAFVTVCVGEAYVPHTRRLLASIRQFHPAAKIYVIGDKDIEDAPEHERIEPRPEHIANPGTALLSLLDYVREDRINYMNADMVLLGQLPKMQAEIDIETNIWLETDGTEMFYDDLPMKKVLEASGLDQVYKFSTGFFRVRRSKGLTTLFKFARELREKHSEEFACRTQSEVYMNMAYSMVRESIRTRSAFYYAVSPHIEPNSGALVLRCLDEKGEHSKGNLA